jgi:MerR family redox-sensitive transcriptional activator SoxR
MTPASTISIGQLASRTGLAVSAIRYYEEQGLVAPERNAGGQRRYLRSDIRRLSFVLIAQQFGFSLEEVRRELAKLPNTRTPTKRDWERSSARPWTGRSTPSSNSAPASTAVSAAAACRCNRASCITRRTGPPASARGRGT